MAQHTHNQVLTSPSASQSSLTWQMDQAKLALLPRQSESATLTYDNSNAPFWLPYPPNNHQTTNLNTKNNFNPFGYNNNNNNNNTSQYSNNSYPSIPPSFSSICQNTNANSHAYPSKSMGSFDSEQMYNKQPYLPQSLPPKSTTQIPSTNSKDLVELFGSFCNQHVTAPHFEFNIKTYQHNVNPTIIQSQTVNNNNYYFNSKKIPKPYQKLPCSCNKQQTIVNKDGHYDQWEVRRHFDTNKHTKLATKGIDAYVTCCGIQFTIDKLGGSQSALDGHLNTHRI